MSGAPKAPHPARRLSPAGTPASPPAWRPATSLRLGGDTVVPGHRRPPSADRLLADLWLVLSVADTPGPRGTGGPGPAGPLRPGTAGTDLDRVAALVELAQRGDGEAFGLLYEQYVDLVYRYVYLRVGNPQTAQDLTSETFLRALRRLDTFSWQGRDIAAWFVTIARNLVTDHVKSARFRLEVTTADMLDADQRVDAPDAEVLRRMRDATLVEAIRRLKPDQAECVVLRFLHGLSLAECAEVLGRSEGAVKQLQLRAVRALRRELGDALH